MAAQKEKTNLNTYEYLSSLDDNEPKENDKEYGSDAVILHEKIDKHHVSNVAVMAKYGAGKSSVINTYLSLYRNKGDKNIDGKRVPGKHYKNHYARISLSTFNNEKYDEVSIERSVLQQLLYGIKQRKLPKSKIERTNKTPRWQIFLFVSFMFLTIISTIFFVLDITKVFTSTIKGTNLRWVLFAFASIGIVIIATILVYYRKIKGIKYKDIEANFEIDENNRTVEVKNLINKFIDEVLYFFECVDINLVIFEDLDRLENTEIFAKLRELNTIINQSRKNNSKKVTFLYAVKDDMFKKAEERAKFFDFILPVIPVLNPVTTKTQIVKLFENIKDERLKLSDNFTQNISLYVPDMRILKNTFNDYLIMFSKIFEDKDSCRYLDNEKLFALCLYKNLFPYDYAELERNKGLIPMVINLHFIQDRIMKNINDEILITNNIIHNLSKESLSKFEELRDMFLGQLMFMSTSNSSNRAVVDVKKIATFDGLDFHAIRHPLTGYLINIDVDQKEILTPSGERYIDKEKLIRIKEEKKEKALKDKLRDLTIQKNQIFRMGFIEIIEKYGIDSCDISKVKENYLESQKVNISSIDKDLKQNDLIKHEQIVDNVDEQIEYLKFLILNGYIDEHYLEYTSNYKSAVLSPADTAFMKAVKNHEIDFDASIENVKNVISWLDADDFKQYSILNNTIIRNVELVKEDKNKKKYKNLIELLSNISNNHVLEFLEKYSFVVEEDRMFALLDQLIAYNIEVCADIVAKSEQSNLKDIAAASAIKFCDDYIRADKDEILSNYISTHNKYWDIFMSVNDSKKVIDFISKLNITVPYVSMNPQDEDIQNCIINNNHYKINLTNMAAIFKVDIDDLNNDFFKSNYTIVNNCNNTMVKNYINENIDIYVNSILLNEKIFMQDEDKKLLLALIKNQQLNIALKEKLIAKYSAPFIEDINEIKNDLYQCLFENNCVEPTWHNIINAYKTNGYDCIACYLTEEKQYIGDKMVDEEIKDDAMKLFGEMMRKLKKQTLSRVLPSIILSYNLKQFNLDNINDENLAIAIKTDKFAYSSSDFMYIYNKPLSLCEYLKKYSANVITDHAVFFDKAYPQKERNYYSERIIAKTNAQLMIANVLACEGIDVNIKRKLVEACEDIINIKNNEKAYAYYIINDGQSVPKKILWQIGKTDNTLISDTEKLEIFRLCMNELSVASDKVEIANYLNTIYNGIDKAILGDKKIKIALNDVNILIINKLKELKILDSQKARNEDNLVIKAYKN